MSGNNRIILFFSVNCGMCKDVLTALKKNPDLDSSIIKAQAGKVRYPPHIKSVPSLQMPDPNNKQNIILYEGDDVLKWIAAQSPVTSGELMEFDPMAMGTGWGGAFAGIDGSDSAVPPLGMASIDDPTNGGSNLGRQYDEKDFEKGKGGRDDSAGSDSRVEILKQQRAQLESQLNGGNRGAPMQQRQMIPPRN